jgi:Tol biopolymer transport system component
MWQWSEEATPVVSPIQLPFFSASPVLSRFSASISRSWPMKARSKSAVLFAAVIAMIATVCWYLKHHRFGAYKIEETLLGPVDTEKLSKVISSDGRHFAYVTHRNKKFCVVVDGHAGTEYDEAGTIENPDWPRSTSIVGLGPSGGKVIGYTTKTKDTLVFSSGGKHLLYEARNGNKRVVVVDGQEGPAFGWIQETPVVLSPDGEHVAYGGTTAQVKVLSPDGKFAGYEGGEYSLVLDSQIVPVVPDGRGLGKRGDFPIFSADGKHMAYTAYRTWIEPNSTNTKCSVVLDGHEGPEYAWVGRRLFSPDGKRFAYGVWNGKLLAVVDGVEASKYDGIDESSIIFSPDSKHVAYVAAEGEKRFVVADGQPGTRYDLLDAASLVYSSDSKRLAYVAGKGKRQFVVVDGKEGRDYDAIGVAEISGGLHFNRTPIFSPDGKQLAYAAWKGERQLVVLDGQEGTECGRIDELPIFSSDNTHLAYVAHVSGWAGKTHVVVDGQAGADYDFIDALVFSPDSKRVAYRATDLLRTASSTGPVKDLTHGFRSFAVIDGQPSGPYELVGNPKFSADSKRMGYLAKKAGKSLAVVDGHEGAIYDANYDDLIFSPDSKHVAYICAKSGSKLTRWFVVVDGQEGARYDEIEYRSLAFSSNGILEYLAEKDRSLYRVKYVP